MSPMQVQQDAADFDLSVRFRLDNLRDLLMYEPDPAGDGDGDDDDDDDDDAPLEPQPRMSTVFWPGFVFKVSRTTDASSSSKQRGRLSLSMLPSDRDSLPSIAVYASVAVQSLAGHTYATRALRRQTFDHGRSHLGTLLSQRMYDASPLMQREDAVAVLVTLRSSCAPTPRADPTLSLIHRVLTARPISNTRFIVFRRRDAGGGLSSPRAFFANMKDLAAHYERCDDLLDVADSIEGFELPKGVRLDEYSLTSDPCEYDSDFEPAEDEDEEDGDMIVVKSERCVPPSRTPLQPRADASEDSFTADGPATLENIQSEMDGSASMCSSTDSFDIIQRREGFDLYAPSDFDGTTIVLLGAAARTWEALLYYLYTGFIDFAPLTTSDPSVQEEFFAQYRITHPHRPLPPSCRSIYRLAHKLELEGLRKLALQYLESQLTPDMVLTEVFSEITAKYDEVKQMELALVVRYWHLLKGSSAFRQKMIEVTSGSVPHAADVISEIMLRVSAQKSRDC